MNISEHLWTVWTYYKQFMNTLVHRSISIPMILPNRYSHLSLDRHYQYNQGQWWAVIGGHQLAKTEIEGRFVGQLWFQTAQGQFEIISNSPIWVTHTHGLHPHGAHTHDHVGIYPQPISTTHHGYVIPMQLPIPHRLVIRCCGRFWKASQEVSSAFATCWTDLAANDCNCRVSNEWNWKMGSFGCQK